MIIRLLRINNWIKNLLVFAPVVFSFNLFSKELVVTEVLAFLGFCFSSSAVYIFNDIIDRKKDSLHPRKKNRPIASGKIKIRHALVLLGVLLLLASVIFVFINKNYFLVLATYLFLNIAYSLFLKNINLVEIFVVTLFFILRILAGCAAINVVASEWILMVTFFISVFLTGIKRKSELVMLEDAKGHRKALSHYSEEFLNIIIYISATITIFGYVLYSMDVRTIDTFSNSGLIYSSFFVVLGLFRFIQLSNTNKYEGESDPTYLILKDTFLQITLLLWGISIVAILYFL